MWAIGGLADEVHDILTELNTLKSTVNEALIIEQQAEGLKRQLQSLVYEAQNLQSNPLHLLEQIRDMWGRYNAVLSTAEGMSYSLSQSASRFEAVYPALAGTPFSGTIQELSQASAALLTQIRAASKTAVQSQSIYEHLCDLQRQNDQALASAQQAVGVLQVQQALAQQQALGNEQLAALAEIEAANGRVQTAWIMKQAAEEEMAKKSQERWMEGFGAGGFHGVKEGKGVILP